jgi:hypothetical protein
MVVPVEFTVLAVVVGSPGTPALVPGVIPTVVSVAGTEGLAMTAVVVVVVSARTGRISGLGPRWTFATTAPIATMKPNPVVMATAPIHQPLPIMSSFLLAPATAANVS